jgi:hypothetical protein
MATKNPTRTTDAPYINTTHDATPDARVPPAFRRAVRDRCRGVESIEAYPDKYGDERYAVYTTDKFCAPRGYRVTNVYHKVGATKVYVRPEDA